LIDDVMQRALINGNYKTLPNNAYTKDHAWIVYTVLIMHAVVIICLIIH